MLQVMVHLGICLQQLFLNSRSTQQRFLNHPRRSYFYLVAEFSCMCVTAKGIQLKAANPLCQQQLPVEQWGTNVVSLSFAGRTGGDTYRVLAAYTNTVVTITMTNGTIVVTNQAGQFYEKTNLDGPVWFQSTKPVQVAQFANGTAFDHSVPPFEGDPCEILLPPIGHYLQTNIVFTLPNDNITGDFDKNFLNIITAQSAITNTLVDGSHIATTNFVAIGTSGYYGAQITITNSGVHTITSSQPIGVQVYGFGVFDAYGYFGGTVK
jgi:IgGFc binding protein